MALDQVLSSSPSSREEAARRAAAVKKLSEWLTRAGIDAESLRWSPSGQLSAPSPALAATLAGRPHQQHRWLISYLRRRRHERPQLRRTKWNDRPGGAAPIQRGGALRGFPPSAAGFKESVRPSVPETCSGDEGKEGVNALLLFMEPPDSVPMVKHVSQTAPRSSIMALPESAFEFTRRIATEWLMECADGPKRGTYMEAVADFTGRAIGGAVAAPNAAQSRQCCPKGDLECLTRGAGQYPAVPAPDDGCPLAM